MKHIYIYISIFVPDIKQIIKINFKLLQFP